MDEFQYDKSKSYFELVVPTKDTVRYSWLLGESLKCDQPVFFTGVTGVGKSIIVNSTLQALKKFSYVEAFLAFSSQTTSKETQIQIEEKLEKKRKSLLSGPAGKRVAIFIDDVNMPQQDECGT